MHHCLWKHRKKCHCKLDSNLRIFTYLRMKRNKDFLTSWGLSDEFITRYTLKRSNPHHITLIEPYADQVLHRSCTVHILLGSTSAFPWWVRLSHAPGQGFTHHEPYLYLKIEHTEWRSSPKPLCMLTEIHCAMQTSYFLL